MLYVNAIFSQISHFLCYNLAKDRVLGFWKCLQKRNLNQGFSSYLATFCHFWGFFKVYSIPNTMGNHSHMPKMKEKPCVQIPLITFYSGWFRVSENPISVSTRSFTIIFSDSDTLTFWRKKTTSASHFFSGQIFFVTFF